MKVKALTGFAGAVCMAAGEVRNIADEVLVKDLIGAGYVETVETGQEEKEESKPARRSAGKDADKQDNGS